MSSPAQDQRAEQAARRLAEAADIMLGAMRNLAARLEAAETPQEACELGLALQRVNRGLRQTVLLDARLVRDAAEAERRRAAGAEEARKARTKARAAELRRRVRSLVPKLVCAGSRPAW